MELTLEEWLMAWKGRSKKEVRDVEMERTDVCAPRAVEGNVE